MLSTFGPGRAPTCDPQVDGHRRSGRDRGQRGVESTVGQHGGVDAAGEVAQLGQRLLRLGVGLVEQLPRLVGVGGKSLAGHAEVHREGDEPLLRAVVEVALDPPALGLGRVDHPRAARLEDGHAGVEGVAP